MGMGRSSDRPTTTEICREKEVVEQRVNEWMNGTNLFRKVLLVKFLCCRKCRRDSHNHIYIPCAVVRYICGTIWWSTSSSNGITILKTCIVLTITLSISDFVCVCVRVTNVKYSLFLFCYSPFSHFLTVCFDVFLNDFFHAWQCLRIQNLFYVTQHSKIPNFSYVFFLFHICMSIRVHLIRILLGVFSCLLCA